MTPNQRIQKIRDLERRLLRMRKMRAAGISDRAIAKEYGISRERVGQLLGRQNAAQLTAKL